MASGDWKEMFDAAVAGDLGLLRYHLAADADPNYQHPEYMCTPLVACILAGQYDAAALLLHWGADPKLRSECDAMTPCAFSRMTDKLDKSGTTRSLQVNEYSNPRSQPTFTSSKHPRWRAKALHP